MAPSVTETVEQVTEQVTQALPSKLVPETESAKDHKTDAEPKTAVQTDVTAQPLETDGNNHEQSAATVNGTEEELPKVLTGHREPLKLSGALDQYSSFDVTPVIGREFGPGADLAAWLQAPNSDELLRDLAVTISQRGVVFFRAQDTLTNDLQKELVQRLGELTGKPSTSKLHIHPINNSGREEAVKDDEISVISSKQAKSLYGKERYAFGGGSRQKSGRSSWHSDITFEAVPSDYALLRLTQLPKTGGDTLWASGYEVYDRISPTLRGFIDGLTATYAQPLFNEAAERNNFKIYAEERGAPENVGELLEAVHPVVRTNPVTGWRSVFAVGHHVQRLNGLSKEESQRFLESFVDLIVDNHDLQVRYKWNAVNDVAIWDNRSVYHAATPDYIFERGLGERTGSRAVSLGERPYFDPASKSRREALGIETNGTA